MTQIAPPPEPVRFVTRADGVRLACRFAPGAGPLLLFLPGYQSDMEGSKAQALFAHARAAGRACLLLDYSGCGASDGAFEDGTLPVWRDDVLAVLDALWPQGAFVPVGSSMGGWLALLVALARPGRVAALMGLAAAPDFTHWGASADQVAALRRDGRLVEPSPYGGDSVMTLAFWQSGEAHRLLEGPIALECPVCLIQGQEDEEVPWKIALRLGECLRSRQVQTILVKDAGHRLSRDADIALILGALDRLLEAL